jgi:hypothetical protein
MIGARQFLVEDNNLQSYKIFRFFPTNKIKSDLHKES